ncbi:hypothetical protein ETB97_009742 [Aspergillus alliaceus]|uniref:Uncharacterized protein n=1 Tax=Petromyces alliaceus TaxID=209559 RepID=A0A8H5ZQW4_PETAA|nr:hypothetical protein ETB97_009742 [Aspergillus burnettii]
MPALPIIPLHSLPGSSGKKDDSGVGVSTREYRIHPDQVHLGFNAINFSGASASQHGSFGRLQFNANPTTGTFIIDKYGDRGDYFGQRVTGNTNAQNGSGHWNDPTWNSGADPRWSLGSRHIVFDQFNTISPACGGVNPLACYSSKEPGSHDYRIIVASYPNRKKTDPVVVAERPDTVPWTTPYIPGNTTYPVAAAITAGVYTVTANKTEYAEVNITYNSVSMSGVRVTYNGFSDHGLSFLNGYREHHSDPAGLHWWSRIHQTGRKGQWHPVLTPPETFSVLRVLSDDDLMCKPPWPRKHTRSCSLLILSCLPTTIEAFLPFQLEDTFSSAFILQLIRAVAPWLLPDETWGGDVECILDRMIAKGNVGAPLCKLELSQIAQILTPLTPNEMHFQSSSPPWEPLRNEPSTILGTEAEPSWDLFIEILFVGLNPGEILDLAEQLDVGPRMDSIDI